MCSSNRLTAKPPRTLDLLCEALDAPRTVLLSDSTPEAFHMAYYTVGVGLRIPILCILVIILPSCSVGKGKLN